MTIKIEDLARLIGQVKILAKNYRALTGRPLRITAEVVEYEAARLLRLELAPMIARKIATHWRGHFDGLERF